MLRKVGWLDQRLPPKLQGNSPALSIHVGTNAFVRPERSEAVPDAGVATARG